jgi:outer membrane protein OmpA-like peptidoglycan-associated protein
MTANVRKLFVIFFVFLGAHIVAAQAQILPTQSSLESVTEPLGDIYKPAHAVSAPLARITLYRTTLGYAAGVISVQLNGNYHTSLQLGSFVELCLPAPDRAALGLRLLRTGEGTKNYAEITTLSLKPGQDTFVRVIETGNGRALHMVVDANTAHAELQQTRRQVHVVSRVDTAQPCEPEVVAKPKPVVTQVEAITLSANVLFEIGKADAAGISAEGRAELDRLVALLQKKYGGVEKIFIEVAGYEDPSGASIERQRLSAARANTIKDYMVAGGISSIRISSHGLSDSSPIVSDCTRQSITQSVACNKPNQRVVVAILRQS